MWPAEPIPGQGLYVALAIALILLAVLAALRGATYDRAKGKPRCRKCGYPAHGIDATNKTSGGGGWSCPECGWSPKRAKDLLRVRRSRKWFVVSLLLLAGAWSSWYAIHVQFRRVKLNEPTATALTPTTWWIAVLPSSSGYEDLIVYHRAYPQGKLSGANAGAVPMPGSPRNIAVPHELTIGKRHIYGDPGGMCHIPSWQHRWVVAQLRSVMYDKTQTMDRRCDAAWQYAVFTGVDEVDEVEALRGLLDERDENLSCVVLDAFYERELSSIFVAASAARVAADSIYSRGVREWACGVLGQCGEASEQYVLDWIATDAIDPNFIYEVVAHASRWEQFLNRPVPHYLLRMVRAMVTSRYSHYHTPGLWILDYEFDSFWNSRGSLSEFLFSLIPVIDSLLAEYRGQPANYAIGIALSLPEYLQEDFGHHDARVYEAWAWLLRQPEEELRLTAANGLHSLLFQLDSSKQDREFRAVLKQIIEAALAEDQTELVGDMLAYALESLEDLEQLDAEREADATHSVP